MSRFYKYRDEKEHHAVQTFEDVDQATKNYITLMAQN